MNYQSFRTHTEDGKTISSSIVQDDKGNILITIDGHQIALDDIRCLNLIQMLEIWQRKNHLELCHAQCDVCQNCLSAQKGLCRWSDELKAGVVNV